MLSLGGGLKGISRTIKAESADAAVCLIEEMKETNRIIQVGNSTSPTKRENPQRGRVYDKEGIAPTIHTMQGGNLEPQILEKEMKEYKMIQKCGDRGTDNYSVSDNAYTITSNPMSDRCRMLFEQEEKEPKIKYIGRIRKLTEREAFRLMDVDDTDIDKIQDAGISKSQMYKLAGNSIVVSCLYHIFENLFVKEYDDEVRETLF